MRRSFRLLKTITWMLLLTGSGTAAANIITFEFTGRLTVLNPDGVPVTDAGNTDFDPYGIQSPITSTFTYNTVTGLGSGALIISPFTFLGLDTQLYDISLQQVTGSNYVLGNMLASFGPTPDIPLSLMWDASGMINAIDYGLQAGDVISGSELIRAGATIYNVGSTIPASDGMVYNGWTVNQGPAPLATTTLNTTTLCTPGVDCMGNALSAGIGYSDDGIAGSPLVDGPFPGMQVSIDIGSGNSLTVLEITAVPLPAAAWLFIPGLLSLGGYARRQC